MSPRLAALTVVALLAMAFNSLLSRLALKGGTIDPAPFLVVRIVSGAAVLLLLTRGLGKGRRRPIAGNWGSAAALIAYGVPFTFAYVSLAAGTGALISFGAVQITMIAAGHLHGERWGLLQGIGFALALGGLLALLLPGATAPSPLHAGMMLAAGVAWGIYSLRGRGKGDAQAETAGNFLRAVPLCLLACLPFLHGARWSAAGVGYALLSGIVTSGLGYIVWYTALRSLTATAAATAQLSVPVLAALIAIPLLGETPTARLAIASAVVLSGIALALLARKRN